MFLCALLAEWFPVLVHAQNNPLLKKEFWRTATVEYVIKILDSGDIYVNRREG